MHRNGQLESGAAAAGYFVLYRYQVKGLDHGIGHLASMRPQKNERLNPNRG
jgi:hypothetical protein